MTAEEYFEGWSKVIDKSELFNIMKWLNTIDKNSICPEYSNIFRAFRLCKYEDCKVVMIGQDPYPQKGVATGILFGNKNTSEASLSPSLKVIKKAILETCTEGPAIFDNSMESIASQGVLMINSALTCRVNEVGSHFAIWKPFISSLLLNLTTYNSGLVFVLFGTQAYSFAKYIKGFQYIIDTYHPAYYARKGIDMPPNLFIDINNILYGLYHEKIKFYET